MSVYCFNISIPKLAAIVAIHFLTREREGLDKIVRL